MQKVAYMTGARRFCIQIQIWFAKAAIVWVISFLIRDVSDLGVIVAREIYGEDAWIVVVG